MSVIRTINSGKFIAGLLWTIMLAMSSSIHAQQAEWLWGQRGGGSSSIGLDEEAKDIAVDDSGNVYVCGTVNKSFAVIFDTLQVPTYGENDLFIAKYSCDGKLLWVKTGGNRQGGDNATSIIVDTARDVIYLAGRIRSNSDDVFKFAKDTIITQSHVDFFLMQLKPDGTMNWLRAGNYTFSSDLGIALSPKGNIYALIGSNTGLFAPGYNLSCGIYFSKYDHSGNLLSMKNLSGCIKKVGYGDFKLDALGNFYTGGYFEDTAEIAGVQIISEGIQDAFIAKFDSIGDLIWLKTEGQIGPVSIAEILGLDLMDNTDLYITGLIGGYTYD